VNSLLLVRQEGGKGRGGERGDALFSEKEGGFSERAGPDKIAPQKKRRKKKEEKRASSPTTGGRESNPRKKGKKKRYPSPAPLVGSRKKEKKKRKANPLLFHEGREKNKKRERGKGHRKPHLCNLARRGKGRKKKKGSPL